ncbi:MAG: DUF4239 domain-containing protein [Planctomycetales bacterium]|nr:DUF4239 domain-containing protein [Planctomycetales bacterium]
MKTDFWMDQIPLWGIFFFTVAVVLVSIWVGMFLGQRRRRKPDHEAEGSLGTIISATLGLLAFMLAFTFGIASERFQVRRQLLLDEVNAIRTTYLRAGLLLEPHRSQIRKLLSDYVDIRVELVTENIKEQGQEQVFQEAFSRSESLQDQMWSHALVLAEADRSSEIDALFISALNELIDLHASRVTVFRYHIPPMIWHVLYFITILSMATAGYQIGLSGKSVLKVAVVLALTFSAVVFLIADLDSPVEGRLQVSQRPMLELQQKIQMSEGQSGASEKMEMPAGRNRK